MEATYLVDRELSWLKFNERVMEEGAREEVPLCERLQFLRIFQTNLDEFFRVRVGTLMDRSGEEIAAELEAVRTDVHRLLVRKEALYGELIASLKALRVNSVDLTRAEEWTDEEKAELAEEFTQAIAPYLTAIAIGKRQTFPFLRGGTFPICSIRATRPRVIPSSPRARFCRRSGRPIACSSFRRIRCSRFSPFCRKPPPIRRRSRSV